MKHCPKCRVESRSDADWCWHCGYSYEDAEDKQDHLQEEERQQVEPDPAGDRGQGA